MGRSLNLGLFWGVLFITVPYYLDLRKEAQSRELPTSFVNRVPVLALHGER